MTRSSLIPFGCSLMLVALSSVAHAGAGQTPPAELVGNWDVEKVLVDGLNQMHWGVEPDAPFLLNRTLSISAEEVNFSADKSGCKQRRWPALTATWAALFRKGWSRAPAYGQSTRAAAADYDFDVDSNVRVTAYLLCPTPGRASDQWQYREWVALSGPDTLALHYDNQVLLVLKRRPPGAKPRASFPCDDAVTPTQKAICSDFEAAGLDRSMAVAYKAALQGHAQSDHLRIRVEQIEWLKQRNLCGSDIQCLRDRLWLRVDELGQE